LRYRLNDSEVASEDLGMEVIVIHLNSGNYYSLRGSAPDIWSCSIAGWTVEEIADRCSLSRIAARDDIVAEVSDLVTYFSGEALIVPSCVEERQDTARPLPQGSLAAPLVQKFTDMQELLLVDPIHEVSEAGWPERVQSRS